MQAPPNSHTQIRYSINSKTISSIPFPKLQRLIKSKIVAAAIALTEEESLTNGVWFHVLFDAFSFPTHIIAPECRSNTSNRGDFFAIRIYHHKSFLCL
jgi:hypothetical protein